MLAQLRSRAVRPALAAALLAAAGLGACGSDAEPPTPVATDQSGGAEDSWSEPEAVQGEGSPDGDDPGAGAIRDAAALLADLRARVAEGRGHADASFQRSVQDVAAVLWDLSDAKAASVLARTGVQGHMQVLAVAGDVSRWLTESDDARAGYEKSHPTDVAIHDAFLAAAARGPDQYRVWCEEDAHQLLARHREASMRRVMKREFPDRVPRKRIDAPDDGARDRLDQGR